MLRICAFLKSSICLAAPEQTAHGAQKPGEFGQWLGKTFMLPSWQRA